MTNSTSDCSSSIATSDQATCKVGLRICAIIPVYNGEKLIEESLNSIYAQTSLPDEVLVADDASTDGTRDLVREIARRAPVPTRLIVLSDNTGGPYEPATRAFATTDCDLITILDADDLFEPDAFETYRNEFASAPDKRIGLVTSDFRTFDDTDRPPRSFLESQRSPAHPLRDGEDVRTLSSDESIELLSHAFCLPFKGMVRREAWQAIGGPNLDYEHVCDCDFVWRLASHGDYAIRIIRRPLVQVRLSPHSMSNNSLREASELARLFKRMAADMRGCKENRKTLLARLERELADLAHEARKQRRALTFLRASFQCAWLRLRSHLS